MDLELPFHTLATILRKREFAASHGNCSSRRVTHETTQTRSNMSCAVESCISISCQGLIGAVRNLQVYFSTFEKPAKVLATKETAICFKVTDSFTISIADLKKQITILLENHGR